jgi:hypothetical protein
MPEIRESPFVEIEPKSMSQFNDDERLNRSNSESDLTITNDLIMLRVAQCGHAP